MNWLPRRHGNRLSDRQKSQHRRSPLTRSPTFTWIAASPSNRTSTREPNLISPTRSPQATWSPTLKIENDAARDQSGNLLEYYDTAFAFHGDNILLILFRRMRSTWR
jgi:hypothetical protein